jgi:mitogen-activated protein kinase kinase
MTRSGQIKLCDLGVSGELINSMAETFTGTQYYMAVSTYKIKVDVITDILCSLNVLKAQRIPSVPIFGLWA